jgi:hypothetical protein
MSEPKEPTEKSGELRCSAILNERARIVAILSGIDKEETEALDGWWETSTGAEFGKRILQKILEPEESNGNS